MLSKFKINIVLNVAFAAILFTIMVVIVTVVLQNLNTISEDAETTELEGLFKNAMAELESEARMAEAMSFVVASTPEAAKAMSEGDREALSTMNVPMFKDLKQKYGARQFQFHLPPATSFFRVHKPQKFGDDLSSFRKTVVETNANQKPVRGLEKGVAGLGIRGISPVYYEGRHLGSVEFGMSFGQPFFDTFKKKYNVDIALHVKRNGKFKPFGTTFKGKTFLNNDQLNEVLSGARHVKQMEMDGKPFSMYGNVVKDFSGNAIGVLEIVKDRSHYAGIISSSTFNIIMIGVIAMILGLAVFSMLAKRISSPICEAARAMREIAQGDGDLTCQLKVDGKNEISLMAVAFNEFVGKMRGTITKVSETTTKLASSAESVSSITDQSAASVAKQQEETEQVATAMNEMTATVQEVAKHANEAAEAARTADDEAQHGSKVVGETISSIQVLASDVISAADVIERLRENSTDIGSVLDVIKGIAEQTNLLALNAAIEAARAGEQGRGFAVVADEVRTLASRTQESTTEIEGMIEQLQTGTRDAGTAMEKSRSQAQTSVEQASKAGESLDTITRAVTVITDMNTQIATAAEEQNSVSEEINRNIVNISQVVATTADGAQQISAASGDLASMASDLHGQVGQFKT